jgi:hypothetical protein
MRPQRERHLGSAALAGLAGHWTFTKMGFE